MPEPIRQTEKSEQRGMNSIEKSLFENEVIEALKQVYDPEIPINIYDLGLIYNVEVSPEGHATVTMTLTTPHCPVAESMPGEVELRVGSVPGIGTATVDLVWDPPCNLDARRLTPERTDDDSRRALQFGFHQRRCDQHVPRRQRRV